MNSFGKIKKNYQGTQRCTVSGVHCNLKFQQNSWFNVYSNKKEQCNMRNSAKCIVNRSNNVINVTASFLLS